MTTDRIAAWTLLAFAVALAMVALIFSVLAWTEAATTQPHQDLVRRDLTLKGDLIVDGVCKTFRDILFV